MNDEIYNLLRLRSNDLKRQISYFRHLDIPLGELRMYLFIYPPGLERQEYEACLGLKRGDLLWPYLLEEEFHFQMSSKKFHIFIHGHVKSISAEAQHSFRIEEPANNSGGFRKYYSKDEMESFPWLKMQLDKIVEWLKSSRLVRVNPYKLSEVLGEEVTEADKHLDEMQSAVEGFGRALKNCEIKPGIINPEQDWRERN